MTAPVIVPMPGCGLMGTRRRLSVDSPAQPPPPKRTAPKPAPPPAARAEVRPLLIDAVPPAPPPPAIVVPRRVAVLPSRVGKLTTKECVLLALLNLHHRSGKPVDRGALAVECWRRWPKLFGLPGHPHPDSSRVLPRVSSLMADGLATSNRHQAWTPTDAAQGQHRALRAREKSTQ